MYKISNWFLSAIVMVGTVMVAPGYGMMDDAAYSDASDNPHSKFGVRVGSIPGAMEDGTGFEPVTGSSSLAVSPEEEIKSEGSSAADAVSGFETMPEEALINILGYLSLSDLWAMCQTSKVYWQICQDRDLWKWVKLRTEDDLRSFSVLGRFFPQMPLPNIHIGRFMGIEGMQISASMGRISTIIPVRTLTIVQNLGKFMGTLPFDPEELCLAGCTLRSASIQDEATQNLPAFIGWLDKVHRLSIIKLEKVRLDCEDLTALIDRLSTRFPELASLSLIDNTTFESDFPLSLPSIAFFSRLSTLSIKYQALSLESCRVISSLRPHLLTLGLHNVYMTDVMLEVLLESPPANTVYPLRSLDLGRNNFTHGGLGILEQKWGQYPDLVSLNLSHWPLFTEVEPDLVDEEDFEDDRIYRRVNAVSFVHGLASTIKKLTDLTVSHCGLGGSQHSRAFPHTLNRLVLSDNPIACSGLSFLSPTLCHLSLAKIGLQDGDASSLIEGIESMPLLEEVNLDGNAFSDESAHKFKMYFHQVNKDGSIKKWSMRNNSFSEDQVEQFRYQAYYLKVYGFSLFA